jgi:hypothetical protein
MTAKATLMEDSVRLGRKIDKIHPVQEQQRAATASSSHQSSASGKIPIETCMIVRIK